MKHILITLFVLFTLVFESHYANAQAGYEDVVYLKNGSVIHGVIIEQIPNVSIKIKTKDRNVFVYSVDEVMKITKEEVQRNESKTPRYKKETEPVTNDNIKKSGYTNITELSFGKSVEETSSETTATNNNSTTDDLGNINRSMSIGLQTVNGYQFLPYLSIGLGLGVQIHTVKMILVPVFFDVHANFLAKKITPFASLALGYSYTPKEIFGFKYIGNDNKGGLIVNPAIGVKFFVTPKMALNLSLGFRYQEVQFFQDSYSTYNPNYTYVPEHHVKENLRLYNLKFGFTF